MHQLFLTLSTEGSWSARVQTLLWRLLKSKASFSKCTDLLKVSQLALLTLLLKCRVCCAHGVHNTPCILGKDAPCWHTSILTNFDAKCVKFWIQSIGKFLRMQINYVLVNKTGKTGLAVMDETCIQRLMSLGWDEGDEGIKHNRFWIHLSHLMLARVEKSLALYFSCFTCNFWHLKQNAIWFQT